MGSAKWLNEQEARAWRALQRMNLRLEGELGRRLSAGSGLSHQDYAILVALTDVEPGELRMHELAAELGWERSRLSHQVTRMGSRGLVSKRACPTDRRGAFVAITAEGRRAIESAAPGHVADVRELFIDRLTPEQLDTLADIAETTLDQLDRTAGRDE